MIHLESAILLNMIPEIGPVRFRNLLNHFGELHEVFCASVKEVAGVEGLSETLARKIISYGDRRSLAQKELKLAESLKIEILTGDHPKYPPLLKSLSDAPPLLYCKGNANLLNECSIALVGTRRPTPYGEKTASMLSKDLSQMKIVTVSGLARGIDTIVHKTTLETKGETIAVLGSGLTKIYPPENKKLAEQISETGVMISEFCLESTPDPGHFPRRNRIIAGLSLGTVVIEADEKSGALITARLAAEQGKDIFAVPGPIFSKMSKGPHRLIRDGAKLVQNTTDIIEEITPFREKILDLWRGEKTEHANQKETAPLNKQEDQLLNCIHFEPVHIDALSTKCALPSGEFSKILLNLEMKGIVKSLPGKMYVRN